MDIAERYFKIMFARFRSQYKLPIRAADTILVGVVVAVIMLLIMPMPPLVLDILIGANISIGILLLLSALYIVKPLDFSTFPTVLLLTTLFRLAISIATTRMILTDADAGQIVEQFGKMVSGGNLIVGMVVFLIITIVQFIVISKGAERVAEVSARFSLDAMPGKQLSIDSDLRSGLLSKEDAKSKRHTLEQESKFHGSLDGAMKFVKGDAIASIVIVIVNLLGGLAVGTLYHDMTMGTAVTTFSILTIGDGLAAQIPALFAAMAAGLLVTRTTDETTDRDLGPAIAKQMVGKPHVLFIAAAMCFVMGLIPGFPTFVFSGIALSMLIGGLLMTPSTGRYIRTRLGIAQAPEIVDGGEILIERPQLAAVDPLCLKISMPAAAIAANERLFADLSGSVKDEIDAVQNDLGVRLPAAKIIPEMLEMGVEIGSAPRWLLTAFGAPLGSGTFDIKEQGSPAAHIGFELRRNLSVFLGLQEVTDMLNWLGDDYPEVVKEAVRNVPTSTITEIFRILAEEQVSLRNLRDVVQAIADAGQEHRETPQLLEAVRIRIRRNIVAPLLREGRLPVVMIGSEAEENIRGTLTDVEGQMRLAITPLQMRALVDLVESEMRATNATALLTARDLRRPLRLMIAADLFDLPVISFNELIPSVPLDIAAELRWAGQALTQQSEMEVA